ncbi:MAG: hypothetical protein ACD_7C00115G0002 [uncultured bacterium]|nr:MAG: hypothetical protein ACD_7C00115G0002 [uncultured bacterium]HCU70311.1 hypothetical protein [Candidatus Moranbacteria bacterium]
MEDDINIDEEINRGSAKQWLQDNLRVIISILIVVAIAGGIYSYSKRSEDSMVTKEENTAEESTAPEENLSITTDKIDEATDTKKEDVKETPKAISQETGSSFIETAGAGDGKTVLSRRALANFLEKNQDSSLSAEHKIYIEDYLRKKVSYSGGIRIGTSLEFSKELIQEAIARSKNLNEKQLKNLQKYAVRVPSLS